MRGERRGEKVNRRVSAGSTSGPAGERRSRSVPPTHSRRTSMPPAVGPGQSPPLTSATFISVTGGMVGHVSHRHSDDRARGDRRVRALRGLHPHHPRPAAERGNDTGNDTGNDVLPLRGDRTPTADRGWRRGSRRYRDGHDRTGTATATADRHADSHRDGHDDGDGRPAPGTDRHGDRHRHTDPDRHSGRPRRDLGRQVERPERRPHARRRASPSSRAGRSSSRCRSRTGRTLSRSRGP